MEHVNEAFWIDIGTHIDDRRERKPLENAFKPTQRKINNRLYVAKMIWGYLRMCQKLFDNKG